MKIKTICPFCDYENHSNFPTYEENEKSLKEALSDKDCKDYWGAFQEELNGIYDELKSGKKKTDLDMFFIKNTPVFCNECGEPYYYNPVSKDYDYVERFTLQRAIQKLNKLADIKDVRPCFIYFLYNPNNKFTKIGYTQDIKKRQQELRVGLVETELKLKFETVKEYANNFEKMFHDIFSEYRVQGEWFNLPEKLLKMLKNRENLIQSMIAEGKTYGEIKSVIENNFSEEVA